jgi:hypothetical protein
MSDTQAPRAGDEIHYVGRGIDVETVQNEVNEFWDLLRTDRRWQQDVRDAGIDLDAVAAVPEPERIVVLEGAREANFDALTTAIIIKFVLPVGAVVAKDIWTKFILPRLETKYPPGSLKEKEQR